MPLTSDMFGEPERLRDLEEDDLWLRFGGFPGRFEGAVVPLVVAILGTLSFSLSD